MASNDPSRKHLFFLLAICPFLGIGAIMVLVLKCAAVHPRKEFMSQNQNQNQNQNRTDIYTGVFYKTDISVPTFPVHLDDGATGPTIATGALSLVLSLAAGLFASVSVYKGPLWISPRTRLFVLFTLLAYYLLIAATIIHTFLIHHLSAHFDPSHSINPYDRGTFDPETWTCETYTYQYAMGQDINFLHRQCTFEMASRWTSLSLLLVSIPFGATVVWAMVAESAILRAEAIAKTEAIAKARRKASWPVDAVSPRFDTKSVFDVRSGYDCPSMYSR
ncbi:predicted protein [Uncinocarpus reesii 1704]|uniref:Uncharacterized protein n=1 Tax=Uncinocarpus reesii (strain UAMH 1704) TaxID=336963 RepID=C4JXK4_UNCRE|nr:uncharacterized protein UREG_06377 [Uncinocarpus reesii 1704]EEP81512.1 predicted protein [Uncinocarpus reesii 1704]